jgi:DNA mismatch repair protein MutS2
VNSHALEVLDFHAALEAVAARCGSELGRAALLGRAPGTDVPALRRELERVAEATTLHLDHPEWAPPPPPDARRPLRVLGLEGAVLSSLDLLVLLRLLDASGTLARELRALLGDVATDTGLALLAARLVEDEAAARVLRGIVDDDGVVRDGASSTLRQLRRRIQSARTRIVRRLEALAASLPDRVRVPDASVAVRDGRYVIQIRREGRSEVGGVIHGESATGATLFVEPPLSLQLMNEIQALEREEDREVQRILREATGRLRPRGSDLAAALDALVDMDSLWARALAAARWNAHLPELLDPEDGPGAGVAVIEGRHPLLLEAAEARGGEGGAVPFSLELEPDERALVVSGPNTGGKTVFLKAMGLLPLLAQTGILPPVGKGTRLPVFRDIFADIGDEQSIAASLSTFSAHLARAGEILEGAAPGTLVLMDEMGTGTDPAEGAALARAILETLVARGAQVVVTSHLGAMKRLDTPGSGIVNASLLFDAERIRPTYRFQKGRPGRSYGLAIARRLGLPGEVVDRAEACVDSGEREVEVLLASLEEKERSLAEALQEAGEAREEAKRLRDEARRRADLLAERERGAEQRARDEARRYLLEARDEVEMAIREVREADEVSRAERVREARSRVEAAARAQQAAMSRGAVRGRSRGRTASGEREMAPEGSKRAGSRPAVPPLQVGDRARILGSGARGRVRDVKGDRVTVEVGSLRFELRRGEVERLPGTETPKERAERGGGGTLHLPEMEARPEVHLLGLRVDEVELELGRALDGAVLAHLPELRIVHGKGTGAVKARVHDLLRRDRRVREFRGGVHGEGGAGVTVAVLQ